MIRRPSPAFVAFTLAVIAAIVLTAVAATGALMPGDRAIADALQATPGGRWIEPIADFIAPKYFEYPVVALAVAVALWRRDYALAAVAIFALAATALNTPFKELIERPRPGPDDVIIREGAPGFGYPSGHVWTATLLYGYAMFVTVRHVPRPARDVAVTACIAAIALIAWDRVWDGAHWPSDTLGSLVIGAPLLAAMIWLADVTPRHIAATVRREPATTDQRPPLMP